MLDLGEWGTEVDELSESQLRSHLRMVRFVLDSVMEVSEYLKEAMLGEQAEREFEYWVMDQSSVYINEWSQPKGRKHWSVLHGTLTEI